MELELLVSRHGAPRTGSSERCVYKPGRGERPLWDYPGGLFRREVAAYELSAALGLEVVPETVLRLDGPHGEGSVQRFVDADFSEHYFTLLDEPLYHAQLRKIAAFDLLANNGDRKGGHLLKDPAGRIWGIDHGLCFHVENKLRTVMWDFAGEELPPEVLAGCEARRRGGPRQGGGAARARRVPGAQAPGRLALAQAPFPCTPGRLPGLSLAARVAGLGRREPGRPAALAAAGS